MRESSLYSAVNLAVSGRLGEILADARKSGKSFRAIAFDLSQQTGIRVSDEWVRQQVARLDAA